VNLGMDLLIKSIEHFAISQNEKTFDSCLDEIIFRVNNLYTADSEFEWETLRENYSKIKYLNEVLNFYYVPQTKKLIQLIGVFMDSVDKVTQMYLQEIDWDENPTIQGYLLDSLNANNPLHKLGCVIKAYQLLVPLIEGYRNETFIPKINDQNFIKIFDLKN
jgi:hypothetical protein